MMKRTLRAAVVLAALGTLSACAVYPTERVVVRHGPAWVPGHYTVYGAWRPGHWG